MLKNILKELRCSNGYSQADVAKAIGISRSAIAMYELGSREPDIETIKQFSKFYHVSLSYLLEENEHHVEGSFTPEQFTMYTSRDLAISIKSMAKERSVVLKKMLEDLHLGSNTMSAMYHGKSIAFDTLARIADYLDCSVDHLLGRTEEIKKADSKEAMNDKQMCRVSNFSKRLKQYREMNNYTLEFMEQKTGIPAQTISRYELGQRSPKLDTVLQIAENLKISPLWLQGYGENLGWEHPPQEHITPHELALLQAYRSRTDMQKAVDTLLNI